MSLNNITFVLGQGGLGRPLPGQDHISGLIFYTGSLPSGFTTANRIKQIFSVGDAETLGIKADYNDATAASASYLFTAVGANGDTVNFKVIEPFGVIKDLGTYVKQTGDSTATLLAQSVAALINSGTLAHGYAATATAGTLTLAAPKSLGVFLNTNTPLSVNIVGTIAGTLTGFSGGSASKQAVWHYHISEYFRVQPQGVLYLSFFAVPGAYNFSEIASVQNFANGAVRQIGIYKDGSAFAAGDLTAIDIQCKLSVSAHKELIGILGADISGIADISTMTDLSTMTANTASVDISQDGGAQGAALYKAYGKSITSLGAILGAISLAAVHEDIAWVGKYNMSDGTELDVPAFANGVLLSDPSISDSLLSQLQNYRYIFLRKFVGYAGSFWNEDAAACSLTSDYAFISNNRTIQKATRGVYSSLIPSLNSPIQLNADGTLSDVSTAYFTGLAEINLIQMLRDGELSAQKVAINPAQNVLSTGKLVITVNLVPMGVARNIIVNIGFNVSIQ
jgi:hypothetical protein